MQLFRRPRFAAKAWIISLAFTLPAVALLAWLLVSQSNESRQACLNSTRQVIDVAISLLGAAHTEEVAGTVTWEHLTVGRYVDRPEAGTYGLGERQVAARLIARRRGTVFLRLRHAAPDAGASLQARTRGLGPHRVQGSEWHCTLSEMVALVREDGKGVVEHQWAKPGKDTTAA